MEFHSNNVALLKKKHKIDIKLGQDDGERIKIENGNVGVLEKGGKLLYFDYEDKRIDEFAGKIKDNNKVYILIGFGMGNCVRKILDSIGGSKLIVLENNTSILDCALSASDMCDVLNNDNINIELCDANSVDDVFESNIKSLFFSNAVDVIICPGYREIDEQFVNCCIEGVKKAFNNAIVNKNTLDIISENILKATFSNIPYMIKANDIRNIKNVFKGKTAVVVSSGPSLSKNLHYLKEYNDKIVVITGARNLDYMRSEGIIPHFVCIIDSLDIVYEFTKNSFDKGLFFISTEHANPKTVRKLDGSNMFCTVLLNEFMNKITENRYEKFLSVSSVAHLCTMIAVYTGCKNVLFIGQDLAFTDNKVHDDFSGSKYEYNNVDNRNDMFYVEGNYGKKVLSNLSFQNFKEWLEKYIALNNQVNFINCTEGGAKIKGIKVAPLEETLKKLCKEDIRAFEILKKSYTPQEEIDKYKVVHELMKIEEEIVFTRSQYERGIELCKKIYEFNKGNMKIDIRKAVSEFSEIDKVSEGKTHINSLINILALSPLKKIVNDRELVENSSDSPRQRGIKYALRNKEVCSLYVESMNRIIELIKGCIEEIKGK
ncbi:MULTISPECIES: motility associated factor glycosyltransferase family protein [Clostridium]|uniref:motility associated factor glycosyltransferase family protein n=1 Tax=Clostridium TaxID=1485 RepID=UPI0008263DAC|nr:MULTISPECIES: 6-hydroxymethylpterin diphosphokinase MptE-like protein [Clostridium]PJI07549.1 DUF115 domain-containing protein [Clostridium sp. CT7]